MLDLRLGFVGEAGLVLVPGPGHFVALDGGYSSSQAFEVDSAVPDIAQMRAGVQYSFPIGQRWWGWIDPEYWRS